MEHCINKLKERIVKMNLMLNSIPPSDDSSRDRIRKIEAELDVLLYKYLKLLGR